MSKRLFLVGFIFSLWTVAQSGTPRSVCQGDPNCHSLARSGVASSRAFSSISQESQCLSLPNQYHRFQMIKQDDTGSSGETVDN